MTTEDLMKEFAELIGRALARRWLAEQGQPPPGGRELERPEERPRRRAAEGQSRRKTGMP